jgi:4-amino-4-deoxy-L-arabinose transferase-like glycosyltransferase
VRLFVHTRKHARHYSADNPKEAIAMTAAEAPVQGARPATGWARRLRLPAALLVAAVFRVGLLLAGTVPFNSDEAIVALMARHIVAGARPVFFYGQAYMGSLDAYLIAGLFALFGPSVAAVRAVQVVVFLGTVATTYWLGRCIYRSEWIAGAAAVFVALPSVLATLYTTISLGSYGEVLLIGNLLLLLTLALGQAAAVAPAGPAMAKRLGTWGLLGLLGGVGFWSLSLIGVYLLPIAIYLLVTHWRQKRRLSVYVLAAAVGFAVGAAPWIGFTLQYGLQTIAESVGSAMPVPADYHPIFAFFRHVFYFLLFGLTVIWGLRPPWSAEFLALPLLPYALALHTAVLVFSLRRAALRRDEATPGRTLLLGVVVTLVAAYLLTPFGEDPSGRYFVPLTIPIALFMAETLHWLRLRRKRRSPWRKWFAQVLALGLIGFNWWSNVSAAAHAPGLTTQFDAVAQVDMRAMPALMAFLREHGETRGYSNYWVSYPLAFESDEELIFAPALPYHFDFRYTTRYNRYQPYARLVADSPRAAYITTQHEPLNDRLRQGLADLQVTFQEARLGAFHIFYNLSRHVTPDELGLGADCCTP